MHSDVRSVKCGAALSDQKELNKMYGKISLGFHLCRRDVGNRNYLIKTSPLARDFDADERSFSTLLVFPAKN